MHNMHLFIHLTSFLGAGPMAPCIRRTYADVQHDGLPAFKCSADFVHALMLQVSGC